MIGRSTVTVSVCVSWSAARASSSSDSQHAANAERWCTGLRDLPKWEFQMSWAARFLGQRDGAETPREARTVRSRDRADPLLHFWSERVRLECDLRNCGEVI